jgi:hypothetical protein
MGRPERHAKSGTVSAMRGIGSALLAIAAVAGVFWPVAFDPIRAQDFYVDVTDLARREQARGDYALARSQLLRRRMDRTLLLRRTTIHLGLGSQCQTHHRRSLSRWNLAEGNRHRGAERLRDLQDHRRPGW